MLGGRFSVTSATIITLIIKGAIFAIGIAIIGAFEPRTIIGTCSSNSSPLAMYQFAPWYHLEAYTDYRDLYLPCLIAPFLNGHGAYHLGTIVYNYPPLFLYLISGFAYLANIVWLPALPLVLSDILTVIPLYLILKEFVFRGDSRLAFVASVFWAANPINLFYNDLIWLNTGPTTFFMILAIYLFLKQNWFFSSLALAVSTGFKQIAVVLFPILLIFLWKATGFSKKLIVYAFSYILLLVLISTPYVFNDAQNYFWSLNFPLFGIPSNVSSSPPKFSASLGDPVRITTFLGYLSSGMANVVSVSYQYLDYILAGAFALLLIYLFLNSLSRLPRTSTQELEQQTISAEKKDLRRRISEYFGFRVKGTFSANQVLVYSLVVMLMFFALFGRGVYKYYFASITPLGIPLFRHRFGAVIFEVFSIVLFLAPREVTPWMAVLLLTFVPEMLQRQMP